MLFIHGDVYEYSTLTRESHSNKSTNPFFRSDIRDEDDFASNNAQTVHSRAFSEWVCRRLCLFFSLFSSLASHFERTNWHDSAMAVRLLK